MSIHSETAEAIQDLRKLTADEAQYVTDPVELKMRDKLTEEKIAKLEARRDELLAKYPLTMKLLDRNILVGRHRYDTWYFASKPGQWRLTLGNGILNTLERNLKDPSKIPLTLAKPNIDTATKEILIEAINKETL